MAVASVVLLLFAGTKAAAQSHGDYRSGGYDAELAQSRACVEKNLPLDVWSAISIGFYKEGFIWADGFGLADLENQVPATAASAYRLAHVTKPLTAIGVLALMERAEVDLDAGLTAPVGPPPAVNPDGPVVGLARSQIDAGALRWTSLGHWSKEVTGK
jgi:CubicO group peptidase (beta-lactamase class C family)